MNHRFLLSLLVPAALVAGFSTGGCKRQQSADLAPEVARLNAELEVAKTKLAAAEKESAKKSDQLAIAPAEGGSPGASKAKPDEKDATSGKKDEEIKKLQAELDALKKSDGVVFAAIRGTEAQGLISNALGQYQEFVVNFPNSPLIPNAKAAISELTVSVSRRNDAVDPGLREREVKKRFTEGVVTLEEIAPVLKKKSSADVIKYLGTPSKVFRNGAEIGYADRVINNSNGTRGMLIVRFDEGLVAGVRVDYLGQEFKP